MEKDRSAYSVVRFGRYMQGSVDAQAKQPIEWIVIRKEQKKTWLLSLHCLDCMHYHFKNTDIDWAHSDLRAWLMEVFLPRAFDSNEQRFLCPIPIAPEYAFEQKTADTHQCEVYDLVSLLDREEAMAFFPTCQSRQCTTTDYAEAILQKRNVRHPAGICSWWVRNNRLKHWKALAIGRMGLINMYPVTDAITMVRPLICVDDDHGLARSEWDRDEDLSN